MARRFRADAALKNGRLRFLFQAEMFATGSFRKSSVAGLSSGRGQSPDQAPPARSTQDDPLRASTRRTNTACASQTAEVPPFALCARDSCSLPGLTEVDLPSDLACADPRSFHQEGLLSRPMTLSISDAPHGPPARPRIHG